VHDQIDSCHIPEDFGPCPRESPFVTRGRACHVSRSLSLSLCPMFTHTHIYIHTQSHIFTRSCAIIMQYIQRLCQSRRCAADRAYFKAAV
jgi:hypothetical protein